MNRVYLLLGSNMGNRQQMLDDAVELLVERLLPDYIEVEDLAEAVNTSSVLETEPWGFESSDKFLNQAFVCLTELEAEDILKVCLEIEAELGRVRNGNGFNEKGERIYTSRVIDIDILLFDKQIDGKYIPQIINTPVLQVPHPRLHERAFALQPLVELVKNYIHPICRKSIGVLNKEVKR